MSENNNGGRPFSLERLQEVIMYAASELTYDPQFGSLKANKVPFYADFTAYRRTGTSITGAKYQHLPQGPAAKDFLAALEGLGGDIVIETHDTPVGTRKALVPLRAPDMDGFADEELAILDEVIEMLRPLSNQQVSDLSHTTAAWKLTRLKEETPYESAILSSEEPSESDLEWLEEVAAGVRMAG